jgi:hypothetical protein
MSKYILGALATLLAIKGKDGVAKLIDPPPGVSKASDWTDPPKSPPPSPVQQPVRMEPSISPIYDPKAKPEQPPHPEVA